MLRNVLVGCVVFAGSVFMASAAHAGVAGGIALLADFDGDGIADPGVYDPVKGDWFVLQSVGPFLVVPAFGGANKVPVPADYDGDGDADPAIYDTVTGDWNVIEVIDAPTFNFASLLDVPSFGGAACNIPCQPVPADYNGDGIADTATYDTETGDWLLNVDPANVLNIIPVPNFGGTGFVATPGDYDGDGIVDTAVQNIASGNWFLNQSNDGFDQSVIGFGGGGSFTPFGRDFDGDGSDDPAVYDTSNGDWFAVRSDGGPTFSVGGFGGAGFSPVAAFWDADSAADPAVYDVTAGHWFMDLSVTPMTPGIVPAFGGTGFDPAMP